jgi:hypothetical protein
MIALFFLVLTLSVSPFKSKSRLEAENAALRHQLIVLQRRVRGRVQLTNWDRLFLVLLYRWFPSVLSHHYHPTGDPCPSRKSYPRVAVMQSGQNWRDGDSPRWLDGSS